MGDVSRIVEMQALIEGMARSNQAIMALGNETYSHNNSRNRPEPIRERSNESKRSSPSKVSFKIDNHNIGLASDIQAKLDRLDNGTNKFINNLVKSKRIEQEGVIQPPMKFRRDADTLSGNSKSMKEESLADGPQFAKIRK